MHPSFPWEGRGLERWMLRFGRHAAPRVAPEIRRAGESALHERDHRGGDHPIPFRTRQLSPPSPKVLQRQAAGGQGVALMQGASAYPGPSGPFSFLGPSAFFFLGRKAPFLYWGQGPPRPVECSQRLTGSFSGCLANCGVFSWSEIVFRPFLVLWNWILFSLSETIGDDYDLGSA